MAVEAGPVSCGSHHSVVVSVVRWCGGVVVWYYAGVVWCGVVVLTR